MLGLNLFQTLAYATLLSGFATAGFIIIRDSRKPVHDPANEEAHGDWPFVPDIVTVDGDDFNAGPWFSPFHDREQ